MERPNSLSLLHRLFRPRFSLRALLIGMAMVGAGLGLFQRLDHQRQLVARIEAAGGGCHFGTKPRTFFDDCFRRWFPQSYLDRVVGVRFDNHAKNMDATLPHVGELKSLEYLSLKNTDVSDVGLKHLAGLKLLQTIELDNTQINTGLAHFNKLSSLMQVYLDDSHVDDVGVKHLGELKSLTRLSLENTSVCDAGLTHLAELKSLRYLQLKNTRVSEVGIQQLNTALPNCNVHHK